MRPFLLFGALACTVSGAAVPAFAQEPRERPLSAIEWLEARPDQNPISEPRTSNGVRTDTVGVTSLESTTKLRMGLIPQAAVGFTDSLWDGTNPTGLNQTLSALPQAPLPSMADLRQRLLLADVPAADAIHLERIKGLLDIGSVDAAWAMSRPVADLSPDYFALARDTAFLLEQDGAICDIWLGSKSLDPSPTTRSICLAGKGFWRAAVIAFFTHDTLADLPDIDRTLLSGYLDPELVDQDTPPDIGRADVNPTRFLLSTSIGHPLAVQDLPLAYSVTNLNGSTGWKGRLDAAERLLKAASLTPNQLLGIYTEEKPAASGGVWDRVRAVQDMRNALDTDTVTPDHVARLWDVMEPAGLIDAAASKFATALHELEAIPESDPHLLQLGLLAGLGEVRLVGLSTDIQLRLWRQDVTLGSRLARSAIAAAMAADPEPMSPTADAILDVLQMGARAQEGDIAALRGAILNLRQMGMTQVAEMLAIEFLILVDQSA